MPLNSQQLPPVCPTCHTSGNMRKDEQSPGGYGCAYCDEDVRKRTSRPAGHEDHAFMGEIMDRAAGREVVGYD